VLGVEGKVALGDQVLEQESVAPHGPNDVWSRML